MGFRLRNNTKSKIQNLFLKIIFITYELIRQCTKQHIKVLAVFSWSNKRICYFFLSVDIIDI